MYPIVPSKGLRTPPPLRRILGLTFAGRGSPCGGPPGGRCSECGGSEVGLGQVVTELTMIDDQGSLLATQSDRVTRLSTTNGGRFCLARGWLCSNLQSAAAVAANSNSCVIDP